MLDTSMQSGLKALQAMQPPVLPYPGMVGMPSHYAQQPSMLPPSNFQNVGEMETVSSSIGWGTLQPSNTGLGILPSSNAGGLRTLPPSSTGLGTLLHVSPNIGLGTLPLSNAGLGTLPPFNASLGNLPQCNVGLGTLPLSNAGLDTLPQFSAGLGTLPQCNVGLGTLPLSNANLGTLPLATSLGALQLGSLQSVANGQGIQCTVGRDILSYNAGLGILPPSAGLPPNVGLATQPPNTGLGTTLPQTILSTVLPQMSHGVMHFTPSVPSNFGLPLQLPSQPLSQLPHTVSYPNVSSPLSTLSSSQLVQAKKFEISDVCEGSPETLVHFRETMVMDNVAEGEEVGEEDMLESSNSNMHHVSQTPLIPDAHSGAKYTPFHHHHKNGTIGPEDSVHDHSMNLPAKIGQTKHTRIHSNQPVSTHITSAYTTPLPLSPLVNCSPLDMPTPEPQPQAGGFLPAESQALFNETFGLLLYKIHCLIATPTIQPLLQHISNHFEKSTEKTASEVNSLGTSHQLTNHLCSFQPVVSVLCILAFVSSSNCAVHLWFFVI